MLPVQQCLTFFYFANIVSIHLQSHNNRYGKVEVMQGVQGEEYAFTYYLHIFTVMVVTSQIGTDSYLSLPEKGY
jgi:hypothetical protein